MIIINTILFCEITFFSSNKLNEYNRKINNLNLIFNGQTLSYGQYDELRMITKDYLNFSSIHEI